jgi:hypothetical protein
VQSVVIDAYGQQYDLVVPEASDIHEKDIVSLDYIVDSSVTAQEILERLYPNDAFQDMVSPDISLLGNGYVTGWKKKQVASSD